eukprot:4228974-Prymnesium_polylepis.1
MAASVYGDTTSVEVLLQHAVDLTLRDALGNSALDLAHSAGHTEVAALLGKAARGPPQCRVKHNALGNMLIAGWGGRALGRGGRLHCLWLEEGAQMIITTRLCAAAPARGALPGRRRGSRFVCGAAGGGRHTDADPDTLSCVVGRHARLGAYTADSVLLRADADTGRDGCRCG